MTGSTIASALYYGEAPRWHAEELWFTDIHGQRVHRMVLGGARTEVLRLDDDLPSGLGWLPDDRLVVVAMDTQQLRRLESDGSIVVHADLSMVATGTLNDMAVGPDGTAYVSDTGFRLWDPEPTYAPGRLLVVGPDGEILDVVEDLAAPNGIALSATLLVVAEAAGQRLTAFTVKGDGSLTDRRTYAALDAYGPVAPDGICLDETMAVWLADPIGKRVLRAVEGGEVTEVMTFDEIPAACVLGGPDRRTLIVCVAPHWQREPALEAPLGHIDTFDVTTSGVGTP